jgi:hypothetical protein
MHQNLDQWELDILVSKRSEAQNLIDYYSRLSQWTQTEHEAEACGAEIHKLQQKIANLTMRIQSNRNT